MSQRTAALPADVMDTMTAAGNRFLASSNDFDTCLYEIAHRIADASSSRTGYGAIFRAALSGVAAGLSIGKHIERQRRKNSTKYGPNILEAPFKPDLLPSVTEAGQIMRNTNAVTVANVGKWGNDVMMNYTPIFGTGARSRFMEICAVIWCAGRHYGLHER